MDVQLLEDIGLTKVQAVAYKALIDTGAQSAPALASAIGESRTNGYKILDKLVGIGLAVKEASGGKFKYAATSPVALDQLVKQQAEAVRQKERRLNTELPHLVDYYSAHSEQPGIRFYQGEEGLREMFYDQTRGKDPVYFIRSREGIRHFGNQEAHRLRNLFPAKGIVRYGIIQDIDPPEALPEDRMPVAESDKLMLLNRTWINAEDYDEPVEWVAYGDKLAIISFGEEVMGTVIQSTQIATAFRKLYTLLDSSIRARPNYAELPKHGLYTRVPISKRRKRGL